MQARPRFFRTLRRVTRTVRELLQEGRPTWSFEFFPPKTPDAERQLWTALRELERLQPSFVSVTYGAGGTTREGTVAVTERIATDAAKRAVLEGRSAVTSDDLSPALAAFRARPDAQPPATPEPDPSDGSSSRKKSVKRSR